MATVYKIYPPIGIARIGNSPNDTTTTGDYPAYIGPEYPGQIVAPVSYKDTAGRILRQGARFRVYRYDDNVLVGEVTPDASQGISIAWTVKLANTKASYLQFVGIGHTGSPRNPSVTNRALLEITPAAQTISGISQPGQFFNDGLFMGTPVPLGEIQTDSAGRLIVLGGYGNSASPNNAPLPTFANNNNWHDDVSDGPINAVVTIGGVNYNAVGAWVICPPPRFAPPVPQTMSLYDTLLQAAVNRGQYTVPSTPSFTYDVYPILQAQFLLQWVSQQLPAAYFKLLQSAMNQSAPAAVRNSLFQQFRPPTTPGTTATPRQMMAYWNDYFADVQTGHWVNEPLTYVQYNFLQQWAAGNFTPDWPGTSSSNITPDGLTRAALQNCSGGPFFPGIETSYMTRDSYPYTEAFRLDQSIQSSGFQLIAGDLTKQNAEPWQADFMDCDFEAPLSWWPVSRPEDAYLPGATTATPWEGTISSHLQMVQGWNTLGFLRQNGSSISLYPS